MKESWYDHQQTYQQKYYRDWDWDPRREWDYISKIPEEKNQTNKQTTTQEYFTQKSYHEEMKE